MGDVLAGVSGWSDGAGSDNSKHAAVGVYATASKAGGTGARAYGFMSPNECAFGGIYSNEYFFEGDHDTGMYWSGISNRVYFKGGGTSIGFLATNLCYFNAPIETTGNITCDHIYPQSSATYDLGATDARWRNIYTTDLQLSNMDRDEGNKVDGTKGDWTLQEGEEDLFVINNISGKKYKIALIPTEEET